MSLAFIIFQEYPKTMSAINEQLKIVESLLNKSNGQQQQQQQGTTTRRVRLSGESLKQVDESLELIDSKIGEFGLISISEFIADIIEIFCQYSTARVDVEHASICRAHMLVSKMLALVSPRLRHAASDYGFPEKRLVNWGLLPLSQRIQVLKYPLPNNSINITLKKNLKST